MTDWAPRSGGVRGWRAQGAVFYPLHCSLPILGVDSAEADKVGSRVIRFCAYVDLSLGEGGAASPHHPRRVKFPSKLVNIQPVG